MWIWIPKRRKHEYDIEYLPYIMNPNTPNSRPIFQEKVCNSFFLFNPLYNTQLLCLCQMRYTHANYPVFDKLFSGHGSKRVKLCTHKNAEWISGELDTHIHMTSMKYIDCVRCGNYVEMKEKFMHFSGMLFICAKLLFSYMQRANEPK